MANPIAEPASPVTNAVCRDIELELEEKIFGRRTGNTIEATPITSRRAPVADFVRALFPQAPHIERLGRGEMVALEDGQRASTSSLVFQGLHTAFAMHNRFGLQPEVLMHLIAHEVAATVRLHAESYRHLFTRSAEKATVTVRHDGLVRGSPASAWHEVFPMFNAQLRGLVPAGIMDRLLPGFSTATPETDAAAMVAFMDAGQVFYSYVVETRCGIPGVRLFGAPEDWTKLRVAAAGLAEAFDTHLGPYFRHLLPVLKTLEGQAHGAPVDEDFWRSIYKFDSGSGYDCCGGWMTAFVNYVQTTEREGKGPGTVEKPVDTYDWTAFREDNWGQNGLELGCVPAQVCSAPFIWDYLGIKIPMTFIGGPLGLDDVGGYLTPALSYGVLEAAK